MRLGLGCRFAVLSDWKYQNFYTPGPEIGTIPYHQLTKLTEAQDIIMIEITQKISLGDRLYSCNLLAINESA